MTDQSKPSMGVGGDELGAAGPPMSDEVKNVLAQHADNAYLMLFADRFTVILDDAGRFQKSFDLDEWLGRFDGDDAERLVSLKERIEQRLREIGG